MAIDHAINDHRGRKNGLQGSKQTKLDEEQPG